MEHVLSLSSDASANPVGEIVVGIGLKIKGAKHEKVKFKHRAFCSPECLFFADKNVEKKSGPLSPKRAFVCKGICRKTYMVAINAEQSLENFARKHCGWKNDGNVRAMLKDKFGIYVEQPAFLHGPIIETTYMVNDDGDVPGRGVMLAQEINAAVEIALKGQYAEYKRAEIGRLIGILKNIAHIQ
ncbi:MAG: hypothetical protein LBQ49_00980 [Rickettsiales bacterium]|jgi:hypothetical protein|nr:hypothetical protein [Rickettsiales bacterium]